jgi:membrane associated rhomboid family serine protease/Zn-finger nucleic acid-binding protein
MRCPVCRTDLQRAPIDKGITWVCPSCGGRAVGMGPLRRAFEKPFVNALWGSVQDSPGDGKPCPVCETSMAVTPMGSPVLDVCKRCQFVWFDPKEFEVAPARPVAPGGPKLSEEQLEVVARVQAEEIAREWRNRPDAELLPQDLSIIPGALGLPLEEEAPVVNRLPWATWFLVFAVLVGGGFALWDPEIIRTFGLLPNDTFRFGGVTFITSIFVHAGLFHMVTNLYFLMVFGDNVEDFLGSFNFFLLIFVAAIVGGAVHALFSPERAVPLVGASGGISGVIVFYGLRFPQAKLSYFRLFRWLTMPASAALGLWLVTQIIGARDQLSGASDVSFLAHLGGGAIGLWFWLLWRKDL